MGDDVKPWEILVEAAQLIDSYEEEYCCEAINVTAHKLRFAANSDDRLSKVYQCAIESFSLLSPRSTMDPFEAWWNDYSRDSQAERVLALLFAAEISKDIWK